MKRKLAIGLMMAMMAIAVPVSASEADTLVPRSLPVTELAAGRTAVLGTNTAAISTVGGYQYFAFEAPAEGRYVIASTSRNASISVYKKDRNSVYGSSNQDGSRIYKMNGEEVYYIRISSNAVENVSFTIAEKKDITGMTATAVTGTFSEKDGRPECEVTVTLADGSTVKKKIRIESYWNGDYLTDIDGYSYYLSGQILDANGQSVYGDYTPGTYQAKIICWYEDDYEDDGRMEVASVTVPVTYVDWKSNATDIAMETLITANIDKASKNFYYKFVPEDSGTYEFHSAAMTASTEGYATLWDVDGIEQATSWFYGPVGESKGNELVIRANLTAGVPYYLGIKYYEVYDAQNALVVGPLTFRVDRYSQKCGTTHTWSATPVTGTAATCSTAGSQYTECSVCHAKKNVKEIPATGAHTYQVIVDRAATCTDEGRQHEECSVCGVKKDATAIPAKGHSFGAYKTVQAATVAEEGVKERTCSVCGEKESVSIAKLKATIKSNKKSLSLNVGKSATLKITYGKGDSIESFTSSKPSVATVSSKGKITAKAPGTTTITVALDSGKTAKVKVTVKAPTTKIAVNKKSVSLKKGKSVQLKVTVTPKNSTDKVTYKSSNTKVATVSSKGKITAKKKGSTVITITSGKKKVTCKVTVK